MYQLIYVNNDNALHVEMFEDSEKSVAYNCYCSNKSRDYIVSMMLIYVSEKNCAGEILASFKR